MIWCAEHCVYIVVGTITVCLGGRVVVGSAFYVIFWWLCGYVIQYPNASYVVEFFLGSFFGLLSARSHVVYCRRLPVKILHLHNRSCILKIWGKWFPSAQNKVRS